jgi:hypothetical protein
MEVMVKALEEEEGYGCGTTIGGTSNTTLI